MDFSLANCQRVGVHPSEMATIYITPVFVPPLALLHTFYHSLLVPAVREMAMDMARNDRDLCVLILTVSLLILTTVLFILHVVGRKVSEKGIWYDDWLIGVAQVGNREAFPCPKSTLR